MEATREASSKKSPGDTLITNLEATRLQDSNFAIEATDAGIVLWRSHQTNTSGKYRGEEG